MHLRRDLGNATYLAAIEHLDTSIGRLLTALEETKQRDNTLVVFLTDNGGVDTQYHHAQPDGQPADVSEPLAVKEQQLENAPLREGKGSMYEGGIRVPCIVPLAQQDSVAASFANAGSRCRLATNASGRSGR